MIRKGGYIRKWGFFLSDKMELIKETVSKAIPWNWEFSILIVKRGVNSIKPEF